MRVNTQVDRKYTVFVSSTYKDLKDERDAVSKAILEIGHIPVGMEMFSAGDEQQWQLIRRQIDQSDYYVVIVAHQYGSMFEGVSYTEREYDYAVQAGVPVLGFVIESNAEWPADRIETNPEVRARLEAFRDKVRSRMVSFWRNADALNAKVLAGLTKEMARNPRPGWLRGTEAAGPEVLAELSRLSKENAELRERVKAQAAPDLAFTILMATIGKSSPEWEEWIVDVLLIVDLRSGGPVLMPEYLCTIKIRHGDQEYCCEGVSFKSSDPNIDATGNRVVVDGPGQFSVRGYNLYRDSNLEVAENVTLELVLGVSGFDKFEHLLLHVPKGHAAFGIHWSYFQPGFIPSG